MNLFQLVNVKEKTDDRKINNIHNIDFYKGGEVIG